MGYEFSTELTADVDANVDEVWNAIATSDGVNAWFMGSTEIADGHVRMVFGDYAPDGVITHDERPSRFAYEVPAEPDGRRIAYDFLIEARTGGTTSLRLVSNGFLPGDDWADEFEAMQRGGAMFFATLVAYAAHFAGRPSQSLLAAGPMVDSSVWTALGAALGLDRPARTGDAVKLSRPGGDTVEGTVYFTNEDTVGVRTSDALYRFMRGFGGPFLAMHVTFGPAEDAGAWSEWLAEVAG
ncbi:MAG TPA: SRPBCC domain-containing protein [Micromonosporaceae bacterium]